ncbi:hypothetical protein VXS03_18200 [Photobacterium sp. S4TG1]|uniref:hypothetical protein n=1 Tax=Photobacterium sp. S4TG1 TaxID=3114587 RepID=UPI002E19FC71|nr:hypothetical protein [Photobacterium sp. S4TG1]
MNFRAFNYIVKMHMLKMVLVAVSLLLSTSVFAESTIDHVCNDGQCSQYVVSNNGTHQHDSHCQHHNSSDCNHRHNHNSYHDSNNDNSYPHHNGGCNHHSHHGDCNHYDNEDGNHRHNSECRHHDSDEGNHHRSCHHNQ